MTKYVVFASNMVSNTDRSLGFLDSLVNEGVLREPVRAGDIRRLENIDFLFPCDTKIRKILQNDFGLEPSYTIVRAGVLDEERLEESIPDFKIRYGYSHHTIYDL